MVLFDAALLAALWRLRKHVQSLPAPEVPTQVPRRLLPARENLHGAAQILGLEVQGRGVGVALAGCLDDLEIVVEPMEILFEPHGARPDLKVTVDALDRVGADVGLEHAAPPPWQHLTPRPPALGDPAFDQVFAARGPPAELRARLDAATRGALLGLPGRIAVQDGRIVYCQRALFEGPTAVAAAVQDALRVAALLARPADLAPPLRATGLGDPEPEMRLGALAALETLGDAEAELDTYRAALRDPEPRIRLLAAAQLGDEGGPTLTTLVSDPRAPLPLRIQAVQAVARLEVMVWLPALRAALFEGPVELAVAAAEALGHTATPEARALITARWPTAPTLLARPLLAALAQLGDPGAEPVLLSGLEHAAALVREAAAVGLGQVGTPNALGPLSEHHRRDRDAAVRRAAGHAVERIQVRHTVDRGRLSLSAPAAWGQLSTADLAESPPSDDPDHPSDGSGPTGSSE